jgi:type I restriction enzyme S subunit
MASEWRDARIDEIAEKVAMGPFGSAIKVETFVSHGVPVISGQHLHGSTIDDNVGFNFVSEAHADRLRNANVRRGDVIFTHAGSIGQVAIVPESSRYERYVISQRQFYMRCDRAKVLPEYVVAYFKTPKGRHQLLANTSQVGVPSIAQPVSYLRTLAIPLPPLHEQRAIAFVLGALDDKIDLNRRMCQTLEEMARALFKSWFVDFDPVRAKMEGRDPGLPKEIADLFPSRLVDSELGPIPEGWSAKSLDEVADFLNGLALQKYPPQAGSATLPVLKIAQLKRGDTSGADRCSAEVPAPYRVVDGDLIFSWSGSLEVALWTGGAAALNQHLFKVNSDRFPRWCVYQWVCQHLPEFRQIAADKATTMGHIQRRHLSAARVAVPPDAVRTSADSILGPMTDRLLAARSESRNLAALRDTLLPKLISGEVRVPASLGSMQEVAS